MLRLKYLFFCSAFAFALAACSDDESGSIISTKGSGDNDIVFDASSSSHKGAISSSSNKGEISTSGGKKKSSSSSVNSGSSSKENQNKSSEDVENAGIAVENHFSDLLKQKCDSSNSGDMIYVSDSSKVFVCSVDEWRALDTLSSEKDDASEADAIRIPAISSPIKINEMKVMPNQDQTKFAITGGALLDLADTMDLPSGAEIYFMDFKIKIFKVMDGTMYETPLQVTCGGMPCRFSAITQVVNFAEMEAVVEDKDKSDCGDFQIVVSYYASYDASILDMYVASDFVNFTRDEDYCKEPEQDIPTGPGTNVVMKPYEVTINTKKNDGFSLSTGKVVPAGEADVYFTSDDLTEEIIAHTNNGVEITPYRNDKDLIFDDDWYYENLPPEPVHMSDFRYEESDFTTLIPSVDAYIFYIVRTPDYNIETGDGLYAFSIKHESAQNVDDGNIQVTLFVYRKIIGE